MKEKIVISAVGTLSAAGKSLDQYFNTLLNKACLLKEEKILNIVNAKYQKAIGIDYDHSMDEYYSRIIYIAVSALKNALKDWNGDVTKFKKIGLVIGSGLGLTDCLMSRTDRNTSSENLLSILVQDISRKCELNCETIYISNACAAGSQAISYGMDLLACNENDLIIAGGIDVLSVTAYAGFSRLMSIDINGCKPFDKNRRGISVGEGATFFILEKESSLKNEKRKMYCELCGAGISNDAFHIVQMRSDGEAIMDAVDDALKMAKINKNDIETIIAHGTGTLQNDKIESQIIKSFFPQTYQSIFVTAPKSVIGHIGGASGAFGMLTAIAILKNGKIPPIASLDEIDPSISIRLVKNKYVRYQPKVIMVNAFGFGGTNVILLCKKIDK